MMVPVVAAGVIALATVSAGPPSDAVSHLGERRVAISLTFSGQRVFLYGQPPHGATGVLAVMEGPEVGAREIMRQTRLALVSIGTRRYEISGVPGLYLVNVHCPQCNGLKPCAHAGDVALWNRLLSEDGFAVGPEAVRSRAVLSRKSARPLDAGEADEVIAGFWRLQESRGLYAVRENSIRINTQGLFYHTFDLPTVAPEGRYRIRTFFSGDGKLVGISENELFVRKSGLVAWLSRLAERRAAAYGGLTVAVAVFAGVLASAALRRGNR